MLPLRSVLNPARITLARFSIRDTSQCHERVGANTGTGMQTMVSVATSSASPSMQTISESAISYPVVDTFRYTYYVTLMMCSAAHELQSVAIYYEE